MYKKTKTILFFCLITCFCSCNKQDWADHNKITNPDLNENLLQLIQQTPDLSDFYQYLLKTGYDKVISSSKDFTVFAPTNEALKAVDPSMLNDTGKLRQLIANHIAYQSYFTGRVQSPLRVKMLDGKHVVFTATKVNNAAITKADQYCKNGVLDIINKALIPQMNAWEYLNANFQGSLQQAELQSLLYTYVDPDSAVQIGVDPKTGLPVYQPGTGLVARNRFLQKVNIDNEDSLLTYIILTNDAFTAEENKLQPYFEDTTAAQTDSITKWNVVKDLAFRGVYEPDSLPATLYSANDSVMFHLSKSNIVSTQKVSNGIVYVMNGINYDMATKIKPVMLYGPHFYDRMAPSAAYTIRTRRNPYTDSIFNDIYMANYGIASYWLRYPATVNSVTYKVYWVAVNDFQTGTFPMRLGFKAHTDTAFADPTRIKFDTEFPYDTVGLNDYNEVYLGDYTPALYGKLDVFLIGNNVTTNGSNTIVMEYIKMVPVLK